ncbi:hypothetical protein ACNOIU_08045 [Exiguobacterium mexicanum]|uniref:Uncharacterized protein n=1 Tax=Exiguobacterium mexicanum TaxID=340146 RepID=A0ABT7ML39_9BACL|nr:MULTISPECIES: hypothetical protein [Exiguobacterium]MDL5376138.1 hypothetical protein [Exiguobacterium mexicanum]
METHWFVEMFTHPSNIPMWFKYGVTIIFWAVVGIGIDRLLMRRKTQQLR